MPAQSAWDETEDGAHAQVPEVDARPGEKRRPRRTLAQLTHSLHRQDLDERGAPLWVGCRLEGTSGFVPPIRAVIRPQRSHRPRVRQQHSHSGAPTTAPGPRGFISELGDTNLTQKQREERRSGTKNPSCGRSRRKPMSLADGTSVRAAAATRARRPRRRIVNQAAAPAASTARAKQSETSLVLPRIPPPTDRIQLRDTEHRPADDQYRRGNSAGVHDQGEDS